MKFRKLLSTLAVLSLIVSLSAPALAVDVVASQLPDGKYATEFSDIYLDNNGAYYAERESTITYLEKINFASSDIDKVYSISSTYELPTPVTESLLNAVSDCADNESVYLFVPVAPPLTRGISTYWSDVYTHTHQGATWYLKDYYIGNTTSTGYEYVDQGAKAKADIEAVISFSILNGTTVLSSLGVYGSVASYGINLAYVFYTNQQNYTMTGHSSDYLQANVHFTAVERQTYVQQADNSWALRAQTYAAVVSKIQWYLYSYNDAKEFEAEVDYTNANFYSINYQNAPTMAVCTTSIASDNCISIQIFWKTLYMDV